MIEGYGVSPARGTVRVATNSDIPAVAALHCAAIDEGFLSTLGERFLLRLYARILASSHGFVLVSEATHAVQSKEPQIAGFVAGSGNVSRLYREFFWRDGPAVARSSGGRLVRSLPRVAETLRYGTKGDGPRARRSSPSELPAPETELLAVAVDGGARRRGTGAALVDAFTATARATGSASARVVVGAENRRAIALYGRAGFREYDQIELHAGTRSLRMRMVLSPAGS
jgi:ribosomal protein S18 acetylase RimI-like enzyme